MQKLGLSSIAWCLVDVWCDRRQAALNATYDIVIQRQVLEW